MKRVVAYVLAVTLLLALFTGCEPAGEHPITTIAPEGDGPISTQPQTQPPKAAAQLPETVVFDEAGIKVTATGLEEGFFGTEIKFLVENTTERNIAFSADLVVINGVTFSGFAYIEAAAGKKANGSLSVVTSDLEAVGIDEIGTITCYDGRIVDTDTFDLLCDVPFTLQTTAGELTAALPSGGDVIFEEAGIRVRAQVVTDEFYGSCLQLLVENSTETHIVVQGENVSVNGFTITAWMYDTVYAGTARICQLDLFSSELEENGITAIEEITFTLDFLNEETYHSVAKSEELQIFVEK